jgi:hypothetical protein
VKLSLCLINYAPCHEHVRGNKGIHPPFLTSALNGGEWSARHPFHFTPSYQMGPRARLDTMEKEKIFPVGNQTLVVETAARHYTGSFNVSVTKTKCSNQRERERERERMYLSKDSTQNWIIFKYIIM